MSDSSPVMTFLTLIPSRTVVPINEVATVLNKMVILSFSYILLAITADARNLGFLTKTITFEAYLVRKFASSEALSPPPITQTTLFRKMGAAPSQTAHAETPFCQKVSSPGRNRRLA